MSYRKPKTLSELCKEREEFLSKLRHKKRQELLMKKRIDLINSNKLNNQNNNEIKIKNGYICDGYYLNEIEYEDILNINKFRHKYKFLLYIDHSYDNKHIRVFNHARRLPTLKKYTKCHSLKGFFIFNNQTAYPINGVNEFRRIVDNLI